MTSPSVLALNANWQAIDVYTPQKAFAMMASGAAAGLDTAGGRMTPVSWEEWLKLPAVGGPEGALCPRGVIRIPRVIIAVNYRFLHARSEPLNHETIARRQNFKCAYSGRDVARKNWSLDHVIPKSRGGKSSWENLVIAHKEVNNRKGDKTPKEAGLILHHRPQAPKKRLPKDDIHRRFGVLHKDWEPFIG